MDEAPGVPFDDVQEVSNYIAALEHGIERLGEGFPLCNRLLREMHEKLMARGEVVKNNRRVSSKPKLDWGNSSRQCPFCATTSTGG